MINNFQNNGNAYGGLTINIPIFNKFSVRSSVENAKLNLINKKVSKGKLELSIKQNLQTAFLRLKSAEKMLDVTKKTGIRLTENMAMAPASSVCGYYFSHQESQYFSVGKIKEDQLVPYSKDKNQDLEMTKKWLGEQLN